MGQHDHKLVKQFFRELERIGFSVVKKKNGTYVITPPEGNPQQRKYLTHGTLKGLTPMRKEISRIYGVKLDG